MLLHFFTHWGSWGTLCQEDSYFHSLQEHLLTPCSLHHTSVILVIFEMFSLLLHYYGDLWSGNLPLRWHELYLYTIKNFINKCVWPDFFHQPVISFFFLSLDFPIPWDTKHLKLGPLNIPIMHQGQIGRCLFTLTKVWTDSSEKTCQKSYK